MTEMKNMRPPFIRSYGFSIILIISIALGSFLGMIFKKEDIVFKPFGYIFLNLLFTVIIPLVFFSISSAVGDDVASMVVARMLGCRDWIRSS
jgi:Na+/H+-dicarboxylate symporter